jgi:hypothetical protein
MEEGSIKGEAKGERVMAVKSKVIMFLALLGMVLAMVGPAMAQDKPADNMKLVLEKIRADKKLFVAENMQLTEGEAKAFWPVYEKYQDELFLLRVRTVKLIKDYADNYEKMTDATANKLLDEYMAIEGIGPKLRQAYLPKFRKVLPPVKLVRYYQIENKIQAAVMYELGRTIPLMKKAQ